MSRKKESHSTTPISEPEQSSIQQVLEQYHSIAEQLHQSSRQAEAESALADINKLSESAQLSLLKALSREQTTDAADVLVAVNALSEHKEARKEARRALIRLEASNTHPQWTPPISQASVGQVAIDNPPRFWKGVVTQMREQGELQLFLTWEQGIDYADVRSIIFLLDYWRAGVKDAIIELTSKKHVEDRMADMRLKLPDIPVVDCTLAEGRRLIEEALSVNTWRKAEPGQDYRHHLPLIKQLIFQASDVGEDRGTTFINPELTDQEAIINFIGAWSLGDYGLAYDLLSTDSTVREGLGRDEWMELRRTWADEAHPARVQLGFVREREQSKSALWVPGMTFGSSTRRESEIGWSIELTETPLSGTLHELPLGTAVNKETGRHWFWTSYIAVKEDGAWRISKSNDEGLAVQGLPIDELQKRIKTYQEAIDSKIGQRPTDPTPVVQELSWRVTQILHFYDALITRLQFDRQLYEEAAEYAVLIDNSERAMVYLQRMADRFAEQKGMTLRRLGAAEATLADVYAQHGMAQRSERFYTLSEQAIRDSIGIQDIASGHLLLGEILLNRQRNEEAEQEFIKARLVSENPDEEAAIEAGLGNTAMRLERTQEALTHFQRTAQINPNYTDIWFSIGFTQRLLGLLEDAEASYRRAIEADPQEERAYSELIAIYMGRQQGPQAREIALRAVRANPDSAYLHALYASVLSELGDVRSALHEIAEAEELAPESEIVRTVRQYIDKAYKK